MVSQAKMNVQVILMVTAVLAGNGEDEDDYCYTPPPPINFTGSYFDSSTTGDYVLNVWSVLLAGLWTLVFVFVSPTCYGR